MLLPVAANRVIGCEHLASARAVGDLPCGIFHSSCAGFSLLQHNAVPVSAALASRAPLITGAAMVTAAAARPAGKC
jgi:hypothetical protein